MHLEWMALAVTTTFVTALLAAGAVVYAAVGTESGAARRLRRRLAPSADLPDLVQRTDRVTRMVAQGLTPLAKLASPVGGAEGSAVRLKLSYAGYRSPYALQLFLAAKAGLAIAGAVSVFCVDALGPRFLHTAPAWAIAVAAFGLFLPNGWLEGRVRERQRAIDEGLPDALDLMVTCVEAGLGLDAALQRVSREIALARPILSEELMLSFLEVKAGARRADAFRRLATRTGVQELKTLAATLNQTELFGTSVAQALRVQAESMRIRKSQKAEERAAVLSVKMTFPLVLCFLPALMAVLLGPAMVNIIAAFKSVR